MGSIFISSLNRMPNNNTTRRNNTNTNSVKTNNSTRRRRRGAITPNNARRIRAQFQKPPTHPGPPVYKPVKIRPQRPRSTSLNNINIGNLTVEEMNAIIESLV